MLGLRSHSRSVPLLGLPRAAPADLLPWAEGRQAEGVFESGGRLSRP